MINLEDMKFDIIIVKIFKEIFWKVFTQVHLFVKYRNNSNHLLLRKFNAD